MTSSASAPTQGLATSSSDPIASPDNGGGSTSNFARPGKSPARVPSEGATNGSFSSITNAATGVYNRAPDLGISGTAKSAYQRAPDLGLGATISSLLGTGDAPGTNGQTGAEEDEEDYEKITRSPADQSSSQKQSSSPNKSDDAVLSRREESLQKGPSSQDRVGKSQQEIGTETGIPTTAGAGSTVSPDLTNKAALDKAKAKGKVHKAHVPEDYEALASPTENAGAGNTKGAVSGNSNHDDRQQEQTSSSTTSNRKLPSSPKSGNHSRKSSSQISRREIILSDGSPIEMETKRPFGEKLKDQVKGEMKILAGTLTGKEEKIVQGLAIKNGDYH
jgi:hypothetical protein